MKKLLVLMMVLAMAGMANAALLISVDGEVDPPETEVTLYAPSGVADIDLWGDGEEPMGTFYLGISGPATLDISDPNWVYPGNNVDVWWEDIPDLADYIESQGYLVGDTFANFTMNDLVTPPAVPAPLDGILVNNLPLHCEGLGEVLLVVTNGEGLVLDTQIIHQVPIPEPMTVVLLGLGGLLLRRRK